MSDQIVAPHGGNKPRATDRSCGTANGYMGHVRADELPCRDCCDAQAVYMRRLRRRREFVAGVNALLAERPDLADLPGAGVRFVVGIGESA